MRLIDADPLYERTTEWEAAAMAQVKKVMNDEDKTDWRKWSAILQERTAFKHDVYDAPTIDAAPIRRGKWIENERGNFGCSRCGGEPWYAMNIDEYNYCPYCGAKNV